MAHILNGAINRPLRDALLIHQALALEESVEAGGSAAASASGGSRTELLISRLVRYHWDRAHLDAIKVEYKVRYGKELVTAVSEATRGDFGEFCTELCITRRAPPGGK